MTREEAKAFAERVICLGFKDETQEFCEFILKLLEQETCEDSISRQAVMNCFKKWQPYMATRLFGFEKELSSLPPVTPKPKTGHWNTYELAQGGINEKWLECSECMWSNALVIPRKYCPNCGARMMEKEDDKE